MKERSTDGGAGGSDRSAPGGTSPDDPARAGVAPIRRLLDRRLLWMLVAVSAIAPAGPAAARDESGRALVGLWESRLRFGPDIRGMLMIRRTADAAAAEIAGHGVPARVEGNAVRFELPDGRGDFHGTLSADRSEIAGFWIQQRSVESGLRYASPVTLGRSGDDEWRGRVTPIDDTQTFYLMVRERSDGSIGAILRNPERNLGWIQLRADRLERSGDTVSFYAADQGTAGARLLAAGRYDPETEIISLSIPNRGGTFDFRKVTGREHSDYYPRGRPSVTYRYARPPALDDGWNTATPEEVGMSRRAIESFIQAIIDAPMDSAASQEDHGVLIARHGKLVVEEYFHGEHRDKPHDTRSASKSVVSDLMGAAMQAGVDVGPSSSVYRVMHGGEFPPGLEPRKRMMTVEHLLTMASGFDCDESNPTSPGYEDNMWNQTDEPDFYAWTMGLGMAAVPGEREVYCSANPNLVGGILKKASGRPLTELFNSLLAEPLGIRRYYLPVSPTGDVTFTGGHRFLPRDFMKLAQVHLDGGTWNGRRIFSTEWSRRATASLTHPAGYNLGYGYLWWVKEYPHNGKSVRAYFASGNGGQAAMAIPDLGLVLAFYGGNYNSRGGVTARNVYVPDHILPAVIQ